MATQIRDSSQGIRSEVCSRQREVDLTPEQAYLAPPEHLEGLLREYEAEGRA
jgi:hypothetical protein